MREFELGASCPSCGWKLPAFSGDERTKKSGFNCPDCNVELIYKSNAGPFAGLTAGSGVLMYVFVQSFDLSPFSKFSIGILVIVFGFSFLFFEKLKLKSK